jgi:peptidylprolyl isomerase
MVPAPADQMRRVRVAADLPESERPTVRVADPRTPAFRARLNEARAARGADFSICDLELPVQVEG